MINIAVINLKKLTLILVKFLIIIVSFFICIKIIKTGFEYFKNKNFLELIDSKYILDENLSFSQYLSNKKSLNNGLKNILVAELSVFSTYEQEKAEEKKEEKTIESMEVTEKENNDSVEITENHTDEISDSKNIEEETIVENVQTNVIENNNRKDVYTDIYKSVKIKNESKYSLTEDMVTPNIDFSNKKDIIIFHTHTCESYKKVVGMQYNETGSYRTLDKEYSVVRVGTELSNYMAVKGYNVIHDSTYHDYPAYTGSYNRSLVTVNNLLSVYNSVDLVLDIHRDALGNNDNYAPCVKIGDDVVAQIMFVIGSDGGGLAHSNWNNNLKLAIKIQEKGNELYPGLFKPIILRNSRYNQHARNGAMIVEVGATGNTIEQCNASMKYFSEVLEQVFK